ncbi:MAG: aminotransferase class V-fold PLP-dependent enzyme [Candidatus Ancillula sp.]|nr:aminotransferase class V-fold PLP-dependent enzyme [Candidatus Ancillula sp.]
MQKDMIRGEFPMFKNQPDLTYLDTAATAQKPQVVIDATNKFYSSQTASSGRGSYTLAVEASLLLEDVRGKVTKFICGNDNEILRDYTTVFTSGATESLNLVARMLQQLVYSRKTKKFNIILSLAEHHSNIIPFQQIVQTAKSMGIEAELKYLGLNQDGAIKLEQISELLDSDTLAISITHSSNVTGKITDLSTFGKLVTSKCSNLGRDLPLTVLDCCQSAPHIPVNLSQTIFDFACYSAHKIYGPNGVGGISAKIDVLRQFEPVFTGGGIVELVEESGSSFQPAPSRFEPGTPNMAGIAGFGAAVDFVNKIGYQNIISHEQELSKYLWQGLNDRKENFGIQTVGLFNQSENNNSNQLALASFSIQGIHPHDLGQVLDVKKVAVRVGHHCAQLVHRNFGIPSSTRVSCGIYTDFSDLDKFFEALEDAVKFFRKS